MIIGAATSSRATARITSTISGASCAIDCIWVDEARSAPISRAAGMAARGDTLASRAMVMPSKPRPRLKPGSKRPTTPWVSIAPPRPASAPDNVIAATVMPFTDMPA
ncbi:MAG: hypothetical protein R2755_15245 [Acidimicrobiales bacterium]